MQSVASGAVFNALSGTIISSASQVIDSAGTITYGMNSPVLGAYNYDLITFLGGNTPAGCHREYILSFQGSTNSGQYIRVRLNNIATEWINTWSADSFRKIAMVRFKESDIILEPTFSYTHQNGINLYYEGSGGDSGSVGKVWNVTLTRLVVKD